jgi:hypothetical protein
MITANYCQPLRSVWSCLSHSPPFFFTTSNDPPFFCERVQTFTLATRTWTALANTMPTPRTGLSITTFDAKFYAIGGIGEVEASTNTVEIFDPATLKWRTHASLQQSRSLHCAGAVGNRIIVAGGVIEKSLNAVEWNDGLEGQSWVKGTPMGSAREACAIVVV